MTKDGEIYICNVCGNVISVIESSVGELVCCNQPMELLEEKTAVVEGKEKHVPIIELKDNLVKIQVGSVKHPMEDEHYISLIQLIKDDVIVAGKRLFPGDDPVAEFELTDTNNIKVRALCNKHGLWASNN